MEINFLSAFNEKQKIRYEELAGPCALLSQDVYSGPLYVGTEEDGEECTLDGETIYVVSWADPNSGYFFSSDMADKIRKAVEDFVDNLPRYYYPDFDGWGDSEPEGEEDEDGNWIEPEDYYMVDSAQWYAFMFSERTWRDIMY